MDGVIVHSTPVHTLAWQQYLADHGIDSSGIGGRMHGLRNDEIVRELWGPGLDDASIDAHGAAKEALYRQMMAPVLEEHLVPGLRPFLDLLGGSPAAVASNAERANLDFVLDGAALRPRFRAVVDGQQVDRPKPAPDIYLRAAQLLGAAPSDCIVFEDSRAGIRAGLDAGMRVVGLTTTLPTLDGVHLSVADFHDPRLPAFCGL